MTRVSRSLPPLRLVATLCAALLVAACGGGDGPGGAGVGGAGVAGTGGIVAGSLQEFTVSVGDRVWFETDSVALTAQSMATLDRQAQWLILYPRYTITIEGHADERGTREYNIALGARRAAAVQTYLASRGVAVGRIGTISYGKERPVAVCDNISCGSQKRRAVTVLGGPSS